MTQPPAQQSATPSAAGSTANAPATSQPAPAGVPHTLIQVRLTAIRYAARDTNLYEFTRADGKPLPAGAPGAHIGVHLPNGIMRQYSLIAAEPKPKTYVVGIKRDAGSRGGSRYVHDELRAGVLLDIEPPRNNFPLAEDAEDTVLFAGGIGITPIHCMIQRLEELGRRWKLYYSCRSRADAAFLGELWGRKNVHFHFDDEAGGFLDITSAVIKSPRDAHLYCCGPAPMLAAFEAAAAAWPKTQVHVEYFTAKEAASLEGGFEVQCAKAGRTFTIPPGRTILHVLREGGIEVSSSCEEGICGACEVGVISGVPDHRDAILSQQERDENKTIFVCCSGAKTNKLVLDL
jgi:ferredoxin-NADP reductase